MGTCHTKSDEQTPLIKPKSDVNDDLPVDSAYYDNLNKWTEIKIEYHKAPNRENYHTENNPYTISIDSECQFDLEINALSP